MSCLTLVGGLLASAGCASDVTYDGYYIAGLGSNGQNVYTPLVYKGEYIKYPNCESPDGCWENYRPDKPWEVSPIMCLDPSKLETTTDIFANENNWDYVKRLATAICEEKRDAAYARDRAATKKTPEDKGETGPDVQTRFGLTPIDSCAPENWVKPAANYGGKKDCKLSQYPQPELSDAENEGPAGFDNGALVIWADGQSHPVSCDLNSDCANEFLASISPALDRLLGPPTAVFERNADYLGFAPYRKENPPTRLHVDLENTTFGQNDDTNPISGTVEFSAADCGEDTCPFYLASTSLSNNTDTWHNVVKRPGNNLSKETTNVRLRLTASTLGMWRPSTGEVAFPAGRLNFRADFDIDGEGSDNGPHSKWSTNAETSFGHFNAATGAFELDYEAFITADKKNRISVRLEANAQERPPVAELDVSGGLSCRGGATLQDLDASYDPDGDMSSRVYSVDGAIVRASTPIPSGFHTFGVKVSDARGAIDRATVAVMIEDGNAPVFEPVSDTVSVASCVEGEAEVNLTAPVATDDCDASVDIRGEMVEIKGQPITPYLVGPWMNLPVGEHRVRWTATDGAGNTTQVFQNVEITAGASEECCSPGQTVYIGSDDNDYISESGDTSWCALMGDGYDVFTSSGEGNDSIFLGPGYHDWAIVFGGHNLIVGNSSGDYVEGGDQVDRIYGGADNDTLYGWGGNDVIFGNDGPDYLLGKDGHDTLVPGPGRDITTAGPGDDQVWVYDVCELEEGEWLLGDEGDDTIYLPIPVEEVQAMGVMVYGFERIVVVGTSLRNYSECAGN